MYRRAFLAASLSAAAGCGSSSGDARTVAPNLRGTPSLTPTPTSTRTRSTPSFEDDRIRPITLANNTHHRASVRLHVREGDTSILEATPSMDAASSVHVAVAAEPDTVYDVHVDASGGHSREMTWRPGTDDGHLWIGLGERITVRDAYGVDAAPAFVTGDTGVVRDSPDEAWAPLLLDNPGGAVSAQVAFSNGDGLGGFSLDVPARARLRLPIAVPDPEVDVGVVVDDAEAETRWRPWTDGPLYARLDRPRFLCDPLYRDLRVVNDTRTDRSARVTVAADGRNAVAKSVPATRGATRIFRAAVPPAGQYVVDVEYVGERTTFEISECPPAGPLVVTLGADGVRVTVRGDDEEGATTVTATER